MFSEQLECFQLSSSTMSLGSLNKNFCQDRPILGRNFVFLKKITNLSLFVRARPTIGPNESVFSLFFKQVVKTCWAGQIQKNYKCFGEKRALVPHCKMYLVIETLIFIPSSSHLAVVPWALPCVSISLTVFTFYLSLNIIVTSLQFYWIWFQLNLSFLAAHSDQITADLDRFGVSLEDGGIFLLLSSLLFLQEIISPSQPSECGQ